jgi:hypothetical protein
MAAAAGQPHDAPVRDELRGPVSELVRQVVVELVREQLNGDLRAAAETAVSGDPENAQETANGTSHDLEGVVVTGAGPRQPAGSRT